jgi:hypothetical protein
MVEEKEKEKKEKSTRPAPITLLQWAVPVLLIALTVALLGVLWTWATRPRPQGFADGFQPPQMAAAQFATKTVRGDLGGVLVAIPAHFANYVQYEGDPGLGDAPKGPRPVITPKSKLGSFAFHVRYPEMVGRDSLAHWQDYRDRKIATTHWILVGINAADMYSGAGAIIRLRDNSLRSMLNPASMPPYLYEKLADREFDLEVYAPKGIDPASGKPYREHTHADDVFIGKLAGGAGGDGAGEDESRIAVIKCSNRPLASAPCRHQFSLEPVMHANVSVSYRRGLLPEWQSIQKRVTEMIYGFSVAEEK